MHSAPFLAAVHIHPGWTIAVAIAVAGWGLWYWVRLGLQKVPPLRRKIRRVSLVFMGLALIALALGLSFIDPEVQQRQYIATWSIALLLIVLTALAAGLDALNTLRQVQQQSHEALREAAGELAQAIEERRRASLTTSQKLPTKNGEVRDE